MVMTMAMTMERKRQVVDDCQCLILMATRKWSCKLIWLLWNMHLFSMKRDLSRRLPNQLIKFKWHESEAKWCANAATCVRSSLWVSWHLIQTVETMFVWCDVQNGLLVIIWRHSGYGEAGWASIHPHISAQSLSLEQSVVDSIMIVVLSYLLHSEHLRKHFILCSSDHFVRAKYALCVFVVSFLLSTLASPSLRIPMHSFFYPVSFFFRLDQYRVERQLPGSQVLPLTKNPLFSYSRTRTFLFNSLSYCVLGHLILLGEAGKVAFVCFVNTTLRMLL